jgi:hypothetical protein
MRQLKRIIVIKVNPQVLQLGNIFHHRGLPLLHVINFTFSAPEYSFDKICHISCVPDIVAGS